MSFGLLEAVLIKFLLLNNDAAEEHEGYLLETNFLFNLEFGVVIYRIIFVEAPALAVAIHCWFMTRSFDVKRNNAVLLSGTLRCYRYLHYCLCGPGINRNHTEHVFSQPREPLRLPVCLHLIHHRKCAKTIACYHSSHFDLQRKDFHQSTWCPDS